MRGTYAFRQRVANSYLVRQRDRRRRRELALVVLVTLPLALGLLGYVWLNLQLLDAGQEVHRLERALHRERELQRRLETEAAFLAHPRRIEERALAQGLLPVTLEQTVFAEETVP